MNVLAPAPPDQATAPLAGVQRQLLGAHCLLLARLLRRSGRHDYAGYPPDNPLERRIVLTLFRIDEGRVSELASHLGHDVAQVSRAFTAMRRAGLVTRGRQREPYRLTPRGQELGEALDAVALRRDLNLTAGLDPQQMFELAGLLGNLLHRASLLLLDELAALREGADEAEQVTLLAGATPVEIHSRAQPLIVNLAASIGRSATAAFKRLTGVSSYEWRVLANIAERPALRFTDLVIHIDSDKAQVSRTLDALTTSGLVERARAAPGEPVRLQLTERGNSLHDIMRADALRRNALLVADLSAAQRQRLQAYLDLLITNAAEMCAGLD
jgi:DNA-binding MarR family transcriptional regulator